MWISPWRKLSFCVFSPLSTLFVRGGVHSTMLNAVNLGLRPQTAGTQICCFNYRISKTNNKSALDRNTCGKQTCCGIRGGYRCFLNLKDGWKGPHVFYDRPYVSLTLMGYCSISKLMDEKSGISIGCFGIERFILLLPLEQGVPV